MDLSLVVEVILVKMLGFTELSADLECHVLRPNLSGIPGKTLRDMSNVIESNHSLNSVKNA